MLDELGHLLLLCLSLIFVSERRAALWQDAVQQLLCFSVQVVQCKVRLAEAANATGSPRDRQAPASTGPIGYVHALLAWNSSAHTRCYRISIGIATTKKEELVSDPPTGNCL